eukprot:scaffold3813_cov146-Amphora_coffeaeformis.AAC.3
MMRSWRLRRRGAAADNNNKKHFSKQAAQRKRVLNYPPEELKTVTIVSEEGEIDKGLVWTNHPQTFHHHHHRNGGTTAVIILSKVCGTAKLYEDLQTGMHLISINNMVVEDAMEARELCEEVPAGKALTLLLWKPGSSSSSSTTTTATSTKKAPHYVTAAIYKDCMDSKTGVSLQCTSSTTEAMMKNYNNSNNNKSLVPPPKQASRAVRIIRLAPTTPPQLRTGMRLISINNYTDFSHHTEAVALIRSCPGGYVTLLFADDDHYTNNYNDHHSRASSQQGDDGTASLTTTAEDDASSLGLLDSSRKGRDSLRSPTTSSSSSEGSLDTTPEQAPQKNTPSNKTPSPPQEVKTTTTTTRPQMIITATLTPDQSQQVVLTETADDVVYVHEAPPTVAALQCGMRVLSLNGQEMASAGHYEHFLQTAEEDVTLCVCWERGADGAPAGVISATALKETFDTKTGVVLANGPHNNNNNKTTVVITRITADSLFPTLTAGMRVLSINGHDWFSDYQEAIGMIRSLQGEITIVATTQGDDDTCINKGEDVSV